MRADGVVMPPPGLDQHLCLGEAVEDLAIEQFVAQRPIEALIISILSWRSRCDVERLHADLAEPFLDGIGDKFGAVIQPYVRGRPTRDEQLCQRRQHVLMSQADARSVIEPQAPALWLALRDLEPLAPPYPLNPVVVHRPSRMAEQCGHPAIAVATILLHQRDDVLRQRLRVEARSGA